MYENQYTAVKENKKAMAHFLSLLNDLKIEQAIEVFIKSDVEIIYNGKIRTLGKTKWLNFLKRKLLNKFTRIVQFNVVNIKNDSNKTKFDIYMICKRYNGNLFFTEIKVQNNWNNNLINQTIYSLNIH